MFERSHSILLHLTRWSAWLGMLFLLGAMLVTTADVVLRKINGRGIFGTVDIVQMMIMGAAYLSIPYGFLTRSHVSVSVIVDMFDRRATALTNLLAAILGLAFMGAIAWLGLGQAIMQAEYGDISLTLGIPITYYWALLLFGSGLSALVCLHMSLEALMIVITGRTRFTPTTMKRED
ncbi:MAG: TRAP transporter small permease [Magnetovibrio sp.]|nr:TRAP transporter small permease [Magnetovibrio sp.]